MNIPAVLPVVRVEIDQAGVPTIRIGNEDHLTDQPLTRSDLGEVLNSVVRDLNSAVRVEVVEADGTTYVDIVTPTLGHADDEQAPAPLRGSDSLPAPTAPGCIAGHGFRPGEDVAIAYVVARQPADADGSTQLRLPPALLARAVDLVMVGLESGITTTSIGDPG